MSANFWFATAKLLHFFELCKSSVKKMPLMFENTNGMMGLVIEEISYLINIFLFSTFSNTVIC